MEEEVRELNDALEGQKRPPLGERPAPLSEVAGPQAAVTVGYVAAGASSLGVPPVGAHDGLDDATVQFLLARGRGGEAGGGAEGVGGQVCQVGDTDGGGGAPAAAAGRPFRPHHPSQPCLRWYVNRAEVLKRKEKRKKEKKRMKGGRAPVLW